MPETDKAMKRRRARTTSAEAVQIELLQGIPEASVAEASAMPVQLGMGMLRVNKHHSQNNNP